MTYNDYISASKVPSKTYLSHLESLFLYDFMGHIRELCDSNSKKPQKTELQKIIKNKWQNF